MRYISNNHRWLLVYMFVALCSIAVIGQSKSDFDFMQTLTIKKKSITGTKPLVASLKTQQDGELDYAFYSLFYVYKTLFSSQDMNVCNFHPSCSEYGLLAIKKKGMFKGSMMTFDRMIRCNPFALSTYEFDYTVNRFLDPVQ